MQHPRRNHKSSGTICPRVKQCTLDPPWTGHTLPMCLANLGRATFFSGVFKCFCLSACFVGVWQRGAGVGCKWWRGEGWGKLFVISVFVILVFTGTGILRCFAWNVCSLSNPLSRWIPNWFQTNTKLLLKTHIKLTRNYPQTHGNRAHAPCTLCKCTMCGRSTGLV